MPRLLTLLPATFLSFIALVVPINAGAVEIKCFAPRALQSTLNELIPQFERSSGHRVSIEYGSAGGLTERLEKGEFADIAIVSNSRWMILKGTARSLQAAKLLLQRSELR